ncbi:hypothetical protein RMCBS344292_19499 [Rhizopus microsporus]|nr:hypothetical protein RMCBS344292_19499 [Rhizopus microsporus]
MIAQENVSSDQQKMVGRWSTDRMVGCYISSLPVEAMKSLTGFPPHQGSYFLPRAVVISPKDLQVLIFPDIEFWKEKFDNDDRVQEDIAGPNFLGLPAQLRVVFLQDSVILEKKYPNYYLWTFELFSNSLYKVFEDQLLASLQEGDAAFTPSQRVTMAIPELVSSLHSGFSSITSTMLAMQTSNAPQMQKLNQSTSDFLTLGSTFFNPNRPPLMPTTPLTQIFPGAQPSSASATSPNSTSAVPTYQLNRDILTVTDVWRECSVGFPEYPSIQSLEAQFGIAWRKDRKELRFFC